MSRRDCLAMALRTASGTQLETRAKGIYKAKWMESAISIRQTLGGKYPHHEPVLRADGPCYFQISTSGIARPGAEARAFSYEAALSQSQLVAEKLGVFDPASIEDARKKTLQAIVKRQG